MRRVLLGLALLVAAGFVVVVTRSWLQDPVAVAVDRPPAATLDELLDRADLVVVGRVADVSPGRLVAGAGPGSGVRTQVADVVVDEVLAGTAGPSVAVEEVVALADGTPATLAGMAPSRVGDAGLWLLERGADETFPFTTPVAPNGRFLLDPDDPTRLQPPVPDDELALELASRGPRALRADVRALAG